ncbi:MAG: NERD domain-containing protein, partial [Proteobacteria bacterium]|nr:NERD domain-containing protein [Pseudomonadota bacterium]
MAIMIPDVIPFPDERSKEPDLFDQFKENLSDDYYVFHSLKFYGEEVGKKRDYEADFVILHPNYGLLCIECKSSYGGCLNGVCEYSDGTPMSDPYNQARTNKYALMKVIADRIDHDSSRALSSFKQNNNNNTIGFYHAVWFGMTKKHFEVARLNYPINGSAEITLFFDETADPKTAEACIEKLFKYSKEQLSDSQKRRMTRLTPDVVHALIGRILCPTFNIAYLPPSERSSNRFARLLRDQMTVLDFLDDQNVTVISGPAGSGKTFIAVEKARRLGAAGDKVLFLC